MVSCSATGQAGALVRNAGYAPIFAALGGLAALTTTVAGLPALYGRQFDARVGVFGALAVVSGLVRRAKTGMGGHFDVSGQEVAATMACEATTGMLTGRSRHPAPGNTPMSTAAETGGGCWPNLPMRKVQANAKLTARARRAMLQR